MTDIVPVPNWNGVRQLETNEYATGGLNGNMNEQAKSLAGQNMYSRLYAGLPFDPVFTGQVGGFPIGGRAALESGDTVRSTIANNTNNPNSNMAGWVNVGNLIIVKTVTEMVSKNLKDGDVVKTLGYNNLFDDSGALYIVSSIPTDYSIPLGNGNHAVFNDDFDIRKFGIRDSATLDQSLEIKRMVAYADPRFYEIDFHGFSIMNPETYHFTTTRGSKIKGMGFNYVHKLKNLHIANNKTKQLVQGTSCILFLPKENGRGIFSLKNVTFDPWVADYAINYTPPVGEGDGMMMGFLAEPHPDWTGFVRATTKTEYSFEFDNIDFKTPAVSYNLAAAGFFSDKVTLKNSIGQYFGLYLFPFCKSLHVDDLIGVLKDDADKKGRTLVMSLVHEEAEIGTGGSVQQDTVTLLNLKATRFTDGAPTIAYKNHSIGAANYKRVYVYDMRGRFECFAGSGIATTFELLEFENCKDSSFTHGVDINVTKWVFKDSVSSSAIFTSTLTHTISSIEAYSSTISKLAVNGYTVATALSYLKLKDSKIVDDTYGLARNNTLHINKIDLINNDIESARLIECSFDSMTIDGMRINAASIANFIYLRHKTVGGGATVSATGVTNKATQQASTQFTTADSSQTVNLNLNFSLFQSRPALANTVYTEFQVFPTLTLSKTFDPPSIAAGTSTTTTLTSTGIANALKVGDFAQASFSIYNADIEISASVSSANTVTVKFKNNGAAAVDLASGTLTVKKI